MSNCRNAFPLQEEDKMRSEALTGSAIRDTSLLWSIKVQWQITSMSPRVSGSAKLMALSAAAEDTCRKCNHLSIYLHTSTYLSIYHHLLVDRSIHLFVDLCLFITICEPSPLDTGHSSFIVFLSNSLAEVHFEQLPMKALPVCHRKLRKHWSK